MGTSGNLEAVYSPDDDQTISQQRQQLQQLQLHQEQLHLQHNQYHAQHQHQHQHEEQPQQIQQQKEEAMRSSQLLPQQTQHFADTNVNANINQDQYAKQVNDRIAEYRSHMPSSGITLFTHRSAPNGYKVAVVLSELGIKYHVFHIDLEHHEERSPSYVELNPNARLPSIIDHDNDNFALWESGAIIEYLCKRPQTKTQNPDKVTQLLGGDDFREQAQVSAWLYFQASGHAPIIGHALQFRYLEASAPSQAMYVVADRFMAEAKRVAAVLEVYLAEKREQLFQDMSDDEDEDFLHNPIWLVGNEITLADLAFIPWNQVMVKLGIEIEKDYPEVHKWTRRIMSRPKVLEALGTKIVAQ